METNQKNLGKVVKNTWLNSKMWEVRWCRLTYKIKKFYYGFFHGIKPNTNGYMLVPDCGIGHYADVIRKGDIYDVVCHAEAPKHKKGTIRLIPCYFNSGFLMEFHNEEGKREWSTILNYDELYNLGKNIKE